MAVPATLARPNQAAGKREGAPVALVPFVRASRERTELADDRSTLLTTSAQAVGPIDVPASGFIRHLVLQVTTSGGVGGGNTVAAQADAPFSVFDDIQLADVNGNPIFGPMNGYSAYLAMKYGAYDNVTDPKSLPSYSAVAVGAGATGHFTFTLRIPVEISGRDGLGSLANMSASQTYKLRYTIAPNTSIYSTAPATTQPTVRVRAHLETWAKPNPVSAYGLPQEETPPAHSTTQYWSSAIYNIASGDQTIRLTRVGNLVRNIIAVLRAAGSPGARSTTGFPDPVRLEYDGSLVESLSQAWFRDRIAQRYGFVGAADAANGLDTGVYVWDFTHDLDGKPGWELRDLLLPTTQGTRLDLRGNFTAGATLQILTNDIAVPSGSTVNAGR